MATYAELSTIREADGFNLFANKVRVAVAIKAQALLVAASPTAAQVEWAKETLANPSQAGDDVVWYVIAANDSASVAQILTATDSAIQTNVDAAVDKLVG